MRAIKVRYALPADADQFEAVFLPELGLMFSVGAFPEAMTHHQAIDAVKNLNHAGFDDWRLPTVQELVGIVDYSRKRPACDTSLFPDARSDWYWTATDSAWSSDYAWIVYFSGGYVGSHHRSYPAFVRAVRRVAPASQ